MSFVTQELYSPGANCIFFNIPCQTAAVTVRSSFLRVPPNHEFAVETQSHREFDRFGTFRTYQRTYVRGGANEAELEDRCTADSDCGTGGYCDMSYFSDPDSPGFIEGLTGVGVCSGGLTNDYGELDFLTFYRPRHNHFMDHLTDQECTADYQCDGRFGAGEVGSVCDRSARRCTVPMAERDLRVVSYYLNPGFPKHLVHTAFETVGDWNGSFMAGHRGRTGEPLPSADGMACQSDNPIGYCYSAAPPTTGATAPASTATIRSSRRRTRWLRA